MDEGALDAGYLSIVWARIKDSRLDSQPVIAGLSKGKRAFLINVERNKPLMKVGNETPIVSC